jgi:tetratricopeptide (TPR) repeat protein
MTVLETRCLDTTQSLPFAPLTRLFGQRVCVEHLFKPPSPVSPIWLAELARLLPQIREHWPKLPAPAALPPEEERRRLFEAFTQTLRALASRPLILFFDDLHWADRATLDWLVYLADRMREEALLLVGAYRPNEASAELIHVVAGWSRAGVARRLPLARLTFEEATELIAALGADMALAEPLQAKSAGNPYVLIELSRTGPDRTPAGLTELVRDRLKPLPEVARQVLQAAAVLETDVDLAALRRTSGRGEEEMLDALDTLLEAGVLVEREGSYEFAHPLVATVLQHDLSIARRSFLHRRATEALEAIYAGRLDSIAGRLAAHYVQAGRPAQAAHYAELAAEHALKLAAYAEAVAFYRKALALEPTPDRQMGLGRAIQAQGDLAGAREAFRAALEQFETQGDQPGAARACLTLAESYLFSGRGDMVVEWAERAQAYLDGPPDPLAQARVHHLLGAGGLLMGRSLAEAEAHLVKATHLATESELPEMAARSQFELGNLLAQRGDLVGARQAFKEAITLARTADDPPQLVLGHNNLAYHALLAGDLAPAKKHIQIGMELAEAHALFIPWQYLYSTRGEIALAEGQLDEAETCFKRALAEAEKHDNQIQAANIRANLGLVARERGDSDEALMLLTDAAKAVDDLTTPHLRTQIDLWLAELYLQRGERAAAAAALKQAQTRLAGSERKGLVAWAARVQAELQR